MNIIEKAKKICKTKWSIPKVGDILFIAHTDPLNDYEIFWLKKVKVDSVDEEEEEIFVSPIDSLDDYNFDYDFEFEHYPDCGDYIGHYNIDNSKHNYQFWIPEKELSLKKRIEKLLTL